MTGWCLHFGFPVTFQENTVWTNRSMDELPESLNWNELWENEWFELMLEYMEKACRVHQLSTANPHLMASGWLTTGLP